MLIYFRMFVRFNLFDFQGLEYFEGAGDSNNIERRLYLQGSTSLSNQPTLSGASCDSFDVCRSLSNEGMIPSPVCSYFSLTCFS